jgi:hypothetical protein
MGPDEKDLDPAFLRFLLSNTEDADVHSMAKQMGELAAGRAAVYALGRACLERETTPPPLSAVLDSFRRVLLLVQRPEQEAAGRKGRKAASKRPEGKERATAVTDIVRLTDAELRRELFQKLIARLEAERGNDPTVMIFTRTPFTFSLSRHGNLLSVDQGKDAHVMRIALRRRHRPWTDDHQGEPWTATVSRTPDKARVALSGGPDGTLNEIVEAIVERFLRETESR